MRNILILSFELIIFIVLLCLYFVFMPNYFDSNYIILILAIVSVSIISYASRKKIQELKGNYITITFLFVLSFLIVHFQIYIDYLLLLRRDLGLTYYLDYNIVPKAITLAALAINSFFIGSILFLLKSKVVSSIKILKKSSFSLGFLRILILTLFLLFIYATPMAYFKGGYGEIMNNVGISYLQYKLNHLLQISIWSYIICIIILISEAQLKINFFTYLKKLKFSIILLILVYFSLTIASGDRGPVINISILLLVGYLVSQKKILDLKKVIIVMFISASLLQFISYFRATDTSAVLSERVESALLMKKDFSSRADDDSIFFVTVELALSLRAYHAVVMDQEHNDILYGVGNLGYLIATVPGLGLLIKSTTSIDFLGSAVYIQEMMGADHGMGTTVLADIYLNFGFLGVLLVFLFFGYFFAKLDVKAYGDFANNTMLMQVLFLLFLSFAIYLGRSTFAIVFSDVVLVCILIKVASTLCSKPVNKQNIYTD